MKTHRGKEIFCPYCGRIVNAHACMDGGDPPRPGDYTYCAYCHEVAVFDDDGGLRMLRKGEIVEALASADRLLTAIRRELGH